MFFSDYLCVAEASNSWNHCSCELKKIRKNKYNLVERSVSFVTNQNKRTKCFSFQFAIPTTKLIDEGRRFEPPRPGRAMVGNEA